MQTGLLGDASAVATSSKSYPRHRVWAMGLMLFAAGVVVGLLLNSAFAGSGAENPGKPGPVAQGPPVKISAQTELVKLPIGIVKGVREMIYGESGLHYGRVFRGIPYAKAGRFEEPQEPDPFELLDCTSFRHSCMRPHGHYMEDMSEDCLHLNVHAPIEPFGEPLSVPVMVWFHGGSFTMGAGSDTHKENVQELVKTHRLVVVTINYRLGVFGFLGSERIRASRGLSTGNFGTLDQQMALKWVQNHISYFGGDPQRVTIVGWSAGAASASVHLSMPGSNGLFRSAIMMSGGFTSWAAQDMPDAEKDYDAFVKAVGCGDDAECLNHGSPCPCLMNAHPVDMLKAELAVPVTWAPTIDSVVLQLHPMDALKRQKVNKNVHIIIGTAIEDALTDIGANATEENFVEFLRVKAKLPDEATIQEATRLYMGEAQDPSVAGLPSHQGNSPAYWAVRRLWADRGMTCVARKAARMWHAASGGDAWWYIFGEGSLMVYDAPQGSERRLSMSGVGEGGKESHGASAARRLGKALHIGSCWPCPGATHGSDLPFLFEVPSTDAADDLVHLARMYHQLWANFIYNSDPNAWLGIQYSVNGAAMWPVVEHGGMWFKSARTLLDPNLRTAQCDFWDKHI